MSCVVGEVAERLENGLCSHAFFEKMKIFNFFLCELPLILRVDRKKNGGKYLQRDSRYLI